jgi:hypothetical protein
MFVQYSDYTAKVDNKILIDEKTANNLSYHDAKGLNEYCEGFAQELVEGLVSKMSFRNILPNFRAGEVDLFRAGCIANNVNFTEESLSFLENMKKNLAIIEAELESKKPDYPFDERGKTLVGPIKNYFKITKTRISLTGESHNAIGVTVSERIWNAVSKAWYEGRISDHPLYFSSYKLKYYNHDVFATNTHIRVGCQTIQRHKLELLAQHMGWDFPTSK